MCIFGYGLKGLFEILEVGTVKVPTVAAHTHE